MSVVALKGENYPTWKLQCKMALVKEGLWGFISGTEDCPDQETEAEKHKKYLARKDRALATIVLAIDTSLLYLLGDPQDPATVWELLSKQFQRRTWANKLRLRKKLFTMRLKEGDSMKEHIKQMTEMFGELAVIADAVSEEDKVVHLLASLPDAYDVLVTALESGSDNVPPLETVTERLLREEEKFKGRERVEKRQKKYLLLAITLILQGKPSLVITVGNSATTNVTVGSGPYPVPKLKRETKKEEPDVQDSNLGSSNLGNVTPTRMPCSLGKR